MLMLALYHLVLGAPLTPDGYRGDKSDRAPTKLSLADAGRDSGNERPRKFASRMSELVDSVDPLSSAPDFHGAGFFFKHPNCFEQCPNPINDVTPCSSSTCPNLLPTLQLGGECAND